MIVSLDTIIDGVRGMKVEILFEVVGAPICKACHRVRLSCLLRADNLAVEAGQISSPATKLVLEGFDEPFLLEPVDEGTIDEFLRVAARGIRIFFAEVFKNEYDTLDNRCGIVGDEFLDKFEFNGGELLFADFHVLMMRSL